MRSSIDRGSRTKVGKLIRDRSEPGFYVRGAGESEEMRQVGPSAFGDVGRGYSAFIGLAHTDQLGYHVQQDVALRIVELLRLILREPADGNCEPHHRQLR